MKITIVTPSFNSSRFLEETIISILSQSGDFYLEFIIMDGGSTDGTLDIIKKYAAMVQKEQWTVRCKGISLQWQRA